MLLPINYGRGLFMHAKYFADAVTHSYSHRKKLSRRLLDYIDF